MSSICAWGALLDEPGLGQGLQYIWKVVVYIRVYGTLGWETGGGRRKVSWMRREGLRYCDATVKGGGSFIILPRYIGKGTCRRELSLSCSRT